MNQDIEKDVVRIDRIMRELARAFAVEEIDQVLDVEINFSYLSVLCHIIDLGEPAMSELSRVCGIRLSTLTRVIDRLVERGFVERGQDLSDRRVVRVRLTEKGKEVVGNFEVARKKKIARILDKLSQEEREKLVGFLENIYRKIFQEKKNG